MIEFIDVSKINQVSMVVDVCYELDGISYRETLDVIEGVITYKALVDYDYKVLNMVIGDDVFIVDHQYKENNK